jgi:hypothetical protein
MSTKQMRYSFSKPTWRCVWLVTNQNRLTNVNHTAKTRYRKFDTNILRKGIAWPQSLFPHSCVCERFLSSHNGSAYFAAGKYVDPFWDYNTLTNMNVDIGTEAAQFPENEYINGTFVAVHHIPILRLPTSIIL